jgi:hypothetical protein
MSSLTAIGACTTLPSSFHFHLAIRYSPIAVVFGSAGASPSHFISSRVPRPVLSQCLPKRSLLKQAEKLEGASPDAPNFSAVRERCPPENHSPFATRCRFGSAGASPSHFISSLVPRPTTRFKSVSTKTKPAEAG